MKTQSLLEGDVVSLGQRRKERSEKATQQFEDRQDAIFVNLDHAIARAIDQMTELTGNKEYAEDMVFNHIESLDF